jgi:hypothetical protein
VHLKTSKSFLVLFFQKRTSCYRLGWLLPFSITNGDAAQVAELHPSLRVVLANARPPRSPYVADRAWVAEGQLALLFDPTRKGQSPSLLFKFRAGALPSP